MVMQEQETHRSAAAGPAAAVASASAAASAAAAEPVVCSTTCNAGRQPGWFCMTDRGYDEKVLYARRIYKGKHTLSETVEYNCRDEPRVGNYA